jgi:hypothetical protein
MPREVAQSSRTMVSFWDKYANLAGIVLIKIKSPFGRILSTFGKFLKSNTILIKASLLLSFNHFGIFDRLLRKSYL